MDNYGYTDSEYVTYYFSTATVVTRTRLNVTLYVRYLDILHVTITETIRNSNIIFNISNNFSVA